MKIFMNNLKFSWKYAKKEKVKIIKYIILTVISILISILVPILGARVIINLTDNKYQQLIMVATVIFGVEILRNIVNFFTRYYSQIIYRETFILLQTGLGREIVKLENKCIDSNSSGLFIQRLTNDTSKLADIFNVLNIYISNIIMDLGIFLVVFIINKIAFIYLILMVIILYIIDHKRVVKVNNEDKIFRKQNEKISGFVGELVRGIRDIKMLNAEDSFINELETKVKELNNQRYKMSSVDRNYSLVRGSVHDLFDLGFIILLVFLITKQGLEVASALILYNYIKRVTSIVSYFGILLDKIKDFNLSSSRIFDLIEGKEFKKEEFGVKHLKKVNGNFEFKNVTFKYNENVPVLNDINFKVRANETVAFVGKSGSGKSTIFNLLCKMYDTDMGEITIDGIDIRELDKESIRGNITIINQNPYIFNLSIRDNLRLVKENLTEEEMVKACRLACLEDFIMSLPEKYDTIVGEGGINLSGGEKQRLAIARAFVQQTEIILFDEATSALDNETQVSIQKAIENMKRHYTILIIAHRLSTVINCDRILFLNNGKIVSEGNHFELLRKNKYYRKLYETEMKKI